MKTSPPGCPRAASSCFAGLLAGMLAVIGLLPAQHAAAPRPPQPAASGPQDVLRVGRVVAPREQAGKQYPEAAAMVEQGLRWLLAHQDKDGRWNADDFMAHDKEQRTDGPGNATQDVALTGLVLLAFAREGVAKKSDAHYGALARGAHWLALQQGDSGMIGPNAAHDYIYGHAIATLGLWAAAAATGSAEARTAAESGYAYLEKHRNPYSVWRYQPRDNDNDTSVTTWATLAYLAAHEQGLPINRQALQIVGMWLDQVTDEQGRTGYTKKGEVSSRNIRNAARFPPKQGEAMTAAGLLCRLGVGQTTESNPVIGKSVELMLAKPPLWEPGTGKVDQCYWFFATEALRHLGGDAQSTWAPQLVDALQKGQRSDGTFAGSWDPVGPWGDDGGRVYATAMSVLALQGLYPLDPPPKAGKAETPR